MQTLELLVFAYLSVVTARSTKNTVSIFPNPKLSARDRVTHDHHHNVDLLTRMDLANKGISRIDSERG